MSTASSSWNKGGGRKSNNKSSKRYVSGHRGSSGSGGSVKSSRSDKSRQSDYHHNRQDDGDDDHDDGRSVATRLLKSREENFVDQFIGALTPVSEDNKKNTINNDSSVAPSTMSHSVVPKHVQQRFKQKHKKRQQQYKLEQQQQQQQQEDGDNSTFYTNTGDTRTLYTNTGDTKTMYSAAAKSLYTNNRSIYTNDRGGGGGGRSLFSLNTNRTSSGRRHRHRGGNDRSGVGDRSSGGTFRYLLYGVAIGYIVLYVYEKHQSSLWWADYMNNLKITTQQEQQQIALDTNNGGAFGIYSNLTQGYLSPSSSSQQQQQKQQLSLLAAERLDHQQRRKKAKENQIASSDSLWQLSRVENSDMDSTWTAKTKTTSNRYVPQQPQQNQLPRRNNATSSFLSQQQELEYVEQQLLPQQPRQIFNCEGMDHLIHSFFPKYKDTSKVIRLKWAGMPWDSSHTDEEREQVKLDNYKLINETATSDDLFVSNILRGDVCLPDSMTNFPGKSLYHNIEAWDYSAQAPQLSRSNWPKGYKPEKYNYLPPNDQIFVLGPHKSTSTNIQVSYLQLLLAFHGQEQRDKIFDPTKRPTNSKQHFCLYINSHYVDYREEAAQAIAKLGSLHTNGICEGNTALGPSKPEIVTNCKPYEDSARPDNIVTSPYLDLLQTNPVDGNEVMFGNYRFGLVLENYYREGYITEKLLNAFLGGTVPIFYGTRQVFDIFNDKAFIYYDIENPQQALDRIAYLEANPEEYDKVLKEPILKDGETTMQQYFSLRDEIGGGYLKKKMLKMMGYRTLDI